MRTKKLLLNSATSLLMQFVTIICGLILPRLLIGKFGSEINGAVSSITQFLAYISLIEAGVGGVTRAALYKPLADKDFFKISGIINATEHFFRKIAVIFCVYAVIIACIFPVITNNNLEWFFTFSLVIIISISTFMQYYFGITCSVLLQADQANYISNTLNIITLILNTIISVILIMLGFSIHIVKLASAVIYILRPIYLNLYVKRKYNIEKNIPADNIAIKQRWNGLGQHIAFFVHNNTDMVVISIMLGLKQVSVYSVYYMVTSGIKNVVSALIGGVEAAFGNMIAKNEQDTLNKNFSLVETATSVIIIIFFITTGLLILDFVTVYTDGISDVNYILKAFAVLITISEALHCFKTPYNSLIWAAGHYKETQVGAFIEAGLNIVFSVIGAYFFGLSGIIIATIISTIVRIIDFIRYLKKNIIFRKYNTFIKRQIINLLNILSVVLVCNIISIPVANYLQCVIKAAVIFSITAIITFLWNFIFYKNDICALYHKLKNVLIKKRG